MGRKTLDEDLDEAFSSRSRTAREHARGTPRDGVRRDALNYRSVSGGTSVTGRRARTRRGASGLGLGLPRKLRGWPPRGGDGLSLEAFPLYEGVGDHPEER